MKQILGAGEHRDLPKNPEGGIEGKMLRMEARKMLENSQGNFDQHVENLAMFDGFSAGLEGDPVHAEMRNELLRRVYDAGSLMEAAERGMKEDEAELKKLDI